MRLGVLIVSLLLTASCATTPGPGGRPRTIAVVDGARDVSGCKALGSVSSRLAFDSRFVLPQDGIRRVIEDLQFQVASAGGDTLWLQNVTVRATEIRGLGKAYRCSK
jgi:hypothetical protein